MNVHIQKMPKNTNQKDHIIQTALRLFAQNGYSATPISLIAKTAKVSQGLMYNFFKSKEDLLSEIMKIGFADIAESMAAYEKEVKPKQAIENHILSTIRIIKQHKEFWKLLHTIRLQDKVATAMQSKFQQIVVAVTSTFQHVFKTMGYDNPKLEALLFLSQIDGLVILYLQDEKTPIDKLGQQLIHRYIK